MRQEILIKATYRSSDARRCRKLPFDVPEGIDRIEVEYSHPRLVEESAPGLECEVPFDGDILACFAAAAVKFYRVELWRGTQAGIPALSAFLNPVDVSVPESAGDR